MEDMPVSSVRVNARELKSSKRNCRKSHQGTLCPSRARLFVADRGHCLCALPFVTITISGFTQRISKQTGHLEDEYILSARINRNDFERLNFYSLEDVDPIEALSLFDLRREMSASYLFRTIILFE